MSNFTAGADRTNHGVSETPHQSQNTAPMSTSANVNIGGTTYTFPDVTIGSVGGIRLPNQTRGHLRSVSHGGSSNLAAGSNSAGIVGRSALKGNYNIQTCI